MGQELKVEPGTKVDLKNYDPDFTGKCKSEQETLEELGKLKERLFDLQAMMYADNRYALLVVIQALDTGGKDGLIRNVMAAFNPQGCSVTPFKAPSEEELEHEYLCASITSSPGRARLASSTGPTTRMSWWSGSTIWSPGMFGRKDTTR